jgi:hypothetical protein
MRKKADLSTSLRFAQDDEINPNFYLTLLIGLAKGKKNRNAAFRANS